MHPVATYSLIAALGLTAPLMAQTPDMGIPLSGAEWRITQLGDKGTDSANPPTVLFDKEEARISGYGGCNRMMGGYAQDGTLLTFSQIASTMMACPDAQMQTERQVFDALSATKSFRFTPDGALELLGDAGVLLQATR